MVKTKQNYLEICLKDYYQALQKSLFDSEWIENLYTDKSNVLDFFEKVGTYNTIRNAVKFMETNKIKYLFDSCNRNILSPSAMEMLYEAGTANQNQKMIQALYEQTFYNANIVAALFNEYSEKQREFFDAKILPFPQSMEETWKPISKFKVGEIPVSLNENGLNVQITGRIHDYFESRKQVKTLKKLYLPESMISNKEFQAVKRKLINFKFCEISTNFAYKESNSNKYKITIQGSQTVANDECEYNIMGKNIKILHICEVDNHEKK